MKSKVVYLFILSLASVVNIESTVSSFYVHLVKKEAKINSSTISVH